MEITQFYDIIKNRLFQIVVTIIVFFILFYAFFVKSGDRCNIIKQSLSKGKSITPVSTTKNVACQKTRFGNFRIQMAYNCCATDVYSNGGVLSLCALQSILSVGVRCLDFDIYSYNNRPIVATSSKEDNLYRESNNFLDFAEVCKTIGMDAFNGSTCPNPNDPLILHLRIHSTRPELFESVYTVLASSSFFPKLAGTSTFLLDTPIQSLFGKVILLVENTNNAIVNSSLNTITNMYTGTGNDIMKQRNSGVLALKDYTGLQVFLTNGGTKKTGGSIMVLPDLGSSVINPDANAIVKVLPKCQMIGMCYQKSDDRLNYYINQLFKNATDNKYYAYVRIDNSGMHQSQ